MSVSQIFRRVYRGAYSVASVLVQTVVWISRPIFRRTESLHTTVKVKSNLSGVDFTVSRVQVPINGAVGDIGYVDIGPKDGPVVLAIHGAPGSLNDFVELHEPLSAAGIRIIVPEFPGCHFANGFGNSEISLASAFDESTNARIALLAGFLNELRIDSVTAVIGHSLGCVSAFGLVNSSPKFRSLVYLNGIGFRPHKAVQPYWFLRFLSWLMRNSWFEVFLKGALLRGYRSRGFTFTSSDGLVAGITAITRIGFEKYKNDVKMISKSGRKVLFAFTKNDKLVEPQIPEEVIKHFGVTDDRVTLLDADRTIVSGPNPNDECYPKVLIFERGGHFVHRSHKDLVSCSIVSLVKSLQSQQPATVNMTADRI